MALFSFLERNNIKLIRLDYTLGFDTAFDASMQSNFRAPFNDL